MKRDHTTIWVSTRSTGSLGLNLRLIHGIGATQGGREMDHYLNNTIRHHFFLFLSLYFSANIEFGFRLARAGIESDGMNFCADERENRCDAIQCDTMLLNGLGCLVGNVGLGMDLGARLA
ncbi:hypothetical protein VTL71DRAFT_12061 [Oculimacula yallundae]|uniref:Uncharacterized protein n=1 Tax=Oculimacula yallundae TaxID=86028 RepID=A0ABR4CSH8_9HELO